MRLPPLDWIRVFETAARTGSFVAAADRLSVSPGAVSRTVKELENYLGVNLFRRLARGVELTETGRELAVAVGPAIEQISAASERFSRRRRASVLRVTVMPAWGERWLVPRLGQFRDDHPNISIEVSADSNVIDLADSNFDLALRYGSGSFGSLESIRLFDDELFPVAAPELASRHRIESYADVFRLPALQDNIWASDWDLWFRAAGITRKPHWRLTSFTLYSMALSAAIEGQGIVMAHKVLVEDELRKGRLVALFGLRVRSEKGFFVVTDPDRPQTSAVREFIEWLCVQAGKEPLIRPERRQKS